MDSIAEHDFRKIFERINRKVNLKGANTAREIENRMRRSAIFDTRMNTLLHYGFPKRCIDYANQHPRSGIRRLLLGLPAKRYKPKPYVGVMRFEVWEVKGVEKEVTVYRDVKGRFAKKPETVTGR